MKLENLHQLFLMELKDLYSAENQIIEALPKLIESTDSFKLKESFEQHLEQTQEHVNRLDEIAESLNFDLGNEKCKGMQGIIEEGQKVLKLEADPEVMDAALISAAQRVGHYEIAGYGTVVSMAKLMGHTKEAEILQKTLDEEKETDKKLSNIAESEINIDAENE
jgi:ferritin-like metal-binding protein YciE